MTRSARAGTFGGIVKPICFSAFKSMMNSNFVNSLTGKSTGLTIFLSLISIVALFVGCVTMTLFIARLPIWDFST